MPVPDLPAETPEPGSLVMEGIPLEVAEVLLAIPGLIDSDARPEIRSILFPDAFDDEERNVEWRRMAHPELEHLFASARELVAKDLDALACTLDETDACRLVIPRAHRHAWVSAIQQCLQILRGEHAFTPDEIEGHFDPDAPWDRCEALWRVHTLYVFQSLLIDAEAAGDAPPAGA